MSAATVAFDPVALSRYAFGHDHWDVPQQILRAICAPHARVAVKACHASSKSFTAADAVLIALLAGGDAIVTAPTWTQVEQVLFGQIHAAITTGKVRIDDWGTINRTEIRLPSGEFALGLSTDTAVRFQGYHSRRDSFLLVVFDEAPGVRTDIYDAVEGISAGGDVRLLYIGNPVIASGPFYDLFATDAAGWQRFTIDAMTTPNMAGLTLEQLLDLPDHELDNNVRPYLVTRRWVVDRHREWGPDHPLYQSRVRGAFPLQSDDALLSLAWLEAARLRPVAYDPHLPVQAGIDVAGPGDDETVLCVRQGDQILQLDAWSQSDTRGLVVAALAPWKARGLDAVGVDVAGIGHYFASALEDADLPVVRINVGESPTDDAAKERYLNLRAQLFWTLREWVSEGMFAGLTDQTALAQLAGLRYAHDSRGRIVIEKKDDARKRGVKSPDRAEAIALAFWAQPRRTARLPLARPVVRSGATGSSFNRGAWERSERRFTLQDQRVRR